MLVFMSLAFVAFGHMPLALPVEAMRPGFHLLGKVVHSHRSQMFNSSHHVAHSLIGGAMAALGVFAMLRHGPFQVRQHALSLLVMAGLAKFMDSALLLLGPLLQLVLAMRSFIALTITAGAWPLPLTITIWIRSLPVTITFAVTFTAWPVAFLPFAVAFAAWFITLNFALWAILVSFVLVGRIRPLVGK